MVNHRLFGIVVEKDRRDKLQPSYNMEEGPGQNVCGFTLWTCLCSAEFTIRKKIYKAIYRIESYLGEILNNIKDLILLFNYF